MDFNGLFAISGINWAYFEIKSGRERENIISVENIEKNHNYDGEQKNVDI